jgi:hypothetical protein
MGRLWYFVQVGIGLAMSALLMLIGVVMCTIALGQLPMFDDTTLRYLAALLGATYFLLGGGVALILGDDQEDRS